MTPEELTARAFGLGLSQTVLRDPGVTIRDSAETAASPTDTGTTGKEPDTRELPVISVDLRVGGPSTNGTSGRDLEVLALLGEGGMGRVYLAHQHSLDRDVAIKSLRDEGSEWHRQALLDEGAVTGHLEHPGIIPVHALGVDSGGSPVLVMKRVEGVAWLELLRNPEHPVWGERGGDPSRRVDDHLEILMQVCSAAHFAHSRGIVHRDIKPQNVLIGRFGEVYLADWGIAYRMEGGAEPQICGTPAYMAPEMAVGGAVDARTDVYLLGATLHEILTGRVKHLGGEIRNVVKAVLASAPFEYGPTVSAALAAIANRATSAKPDDRFASAADLRRALSDHLRHQTAGALAESTALRLQKLRELSERGERTSEDALASVDQLIAEARFGFTQALDQWPESPVAQRGLRELDELLAQRRARAAELERIASDFDPQTSKRQRIIAQVGISLVALGLSASAFVKGLSYEPTQRELILQSFAPVALAMLTVGRYRKQLLATALNRRLTTGLVSIVWLVALHRMLGAYAGMRSAHLLLGDSLIFVMSFLLTGGGAFRWVYGVAVGMMVSAVGCGLFPQQAFFIFSVCTAACAVFAVFLATKKVA